MGTQIWTTVCGGPQHDQYRRSPGFGQGDMESRKHGQSCNHMDVCHSSLGFLGREADLQRGISLWIGVTSTPQLLIHGEVIFFCLRNCCLCAVHQSVKEVRCAKKQRETRNKQKSENKQTNKQTKPHTHSWRSWTRLQDEHEVFRMFAHLFSGRAPATIRKRGHAVLRVCDCLER